MAPNTRMTGRLYVQTSASNQVRISRRFNATPAVIFNAYTDREILLGWFYSDRDALVGCTHDFREAGQTTFVWAGHVSNDETVLVFDWIAIDPPHRLRLTQTFLNWPEGVADTEMRLEPHGTQALLSITMTFANAMIRDAVFSTPMFDQIEEAYQRLDARIEDTAPD